MLSPRNKKWNGRKWHTDESNSLKVILYYKHVAL